MTRAVEAKAEIIQQTPIEVVEILVINDGSSDGTEQIARRFPEVRLINHPKNFGYGAALKTGFNNATGELVGFHDADGTCDTRAFIRFLQIFFEQQPEMIIGTRLGKETKMPLVRQLGNRIFAGLLSYLSGKKIADSASGMRMFPKESIEKLYPLPDGLNFITSMSTRALFLEMKIAETPIPYDERAGQSKLQVIKDGFRFLFTILSVISIYNPLKLFKVVGIFFFLTALGFGASILYKYQVSGLPFEGERYIFRILAILFFFSAGLIFFINGIMINLFIEKQRGLISRSSTMDRMIYHPFIFKKFLPLGISLLVLALVLVIPGVLSYFRSGVVDQLWIVFALSTLLGLIGVELINSHFVMNIFHQYFESVAHLNQPKDGTKKP